MATKDLNDILDVARRVVWYLPPDKAISNKRLFLSHVMTYGTLEDVLTTQRHFTKDDFRDAMQHGPTGVFDVRSWAYWSLSLFGAANTILPTRRIP